jgi:hypothetical protein
MSRTRKRWLMTFIVLALLAILLTPVVVHDASASPAESLTGRLLEAMGIPLTPSSRPRLVFGEGGTGSVAATLLGDTLVGSFEAADTTLHQPNKVTLSLRNEGDSLFMMTLDHVSCACFVSIKLNGKILQLRGKPATLLPGEEVLLEVTLKGDPDEIRPEELPKVGRFGLTFCTNLSEAPKMRVEFTSRLVAPPAAGAVTQAR